MSASSLNPLPNAFKGAKAFFYQLELSSWLVPGETIGMDRMLSIGSFLGLFEMAYANVFTEVVCVDQADFLVPFRPDNVTFHRADLDTADWTLPEGRFNICFMVEILEHLLWSPVALLKWIQAHCDMLVITTPDDVEWPAMPIRTYTRYQHFSAIPSTSEGVRGNPEPLSHCKHYSQAEFVEFLDFCGFRIVELHRVGDGAHQMPAICTPRGR